jgi:DNA-binding beta-propeller fold protein YncE
MRFFLVFREKWPIGWKAATAVAAAAICTAAAGLVARQASHMRVGKQTDGSFIVSTLQRIEPGSFTFPGRPVDMALSPDGRTLAVLDHFRVLLVTRSQTTTLNLPDGAGFRGICWHPSGDRVYASCAYGYIQEYVNRAGKWQKAARLQVRPTGVRGNPRPGGMVITADGSKMYAAALDRNAVAEIDLNTRTWLREFKVDNLPFEVKLTPDEKSLLVTNWGGREVKDGDDTGMTGNAVIVVDPHGAAASGTLSIINRETAAQKRLEIGLHPTGIDIDGDKAYIANAASDTLSEVSLTDKRVTRTISLHQPGFSRFGSMPCDLVIKNHTAYVCCGGDNAICVVDLSKGQVLGFRSAGFFPIAIAINAAGTRTYVLNTKGNGSVLRTQRGLPGNAHDFQGSVTIVNTDGDLKAATTKVVQDNGWNHETAAMHPNLPVYNGAIKHVLYIIKENRTYDEILGDMPEGNGDPTLCDLGESITPNHHALARQFTLMDNAYVTGTNSADGHQWCTQALANDYIEHFYTGYRTYPNNGDCAMAVSSSGCLWDAALKSGKSFRDYGEYCDGRLSVFTPKAATWPELWQDRVSGRNRIRSRVTTRLDSLRPYVNPELCYWPLIQSDQKRADIFIAEYQHYSKRHVVPTLMLLTLPCDHTEGRNPDYPTPQAMVADNDLALGRVVEAVSHSPEWKNTCIFVIEDDAQFGRDHVDGHRTVCYTISPYTRRKYVDHELCGTIGLIRSIELMLKIEPMNRFDANALPFSECFTSTPDYTPYTAEKNRVALDEMNPPLKTLSKAEQRWTRLSMSLDWSGPDRADPRKLSAILDHVLRKESGGSAAPAY